MLPLLTEIAEPLVRQRGAGIPSNISGDFATVDGNLRTAGAADTGGHAAVVVDDLGAFVHGKAADDIVTGFHINRAASHGGRSAGILQHSALIQHQIGAGAHVEQIPYAGLIEHFGPHRRAAIHNDVIQRQCSGESPDPEIQSAPFYP